jgi:hypothetical protein
MRNKISKNSLSNALIAIVLSILFSAGGAEIASADLLGPGPWFGRVWPWGNDTGGIIPYDPRLSTVLYRRMAAEYCALWGRLSHVTSVHRRYGDYVGFVCIDRPGVIH